MNARLDRLRALLPDQKVDCLLISGLANIRYLTGFTGSNALLQVDSNSTIFYTDGRYTTQAAEEVSGMRILTPKHGLWLEALKRVKASRAKVTGFDSNISYNLYQFVKKTLGETRVRAVSGVVERLRMVKDESEIAAIRASAALNSTVFREVLKLVRPGVRECDLAAELEYRMRRHGAQGTAFESIVASGPRSALPHARPTSRAVSPGEFLLFDHGSMLNGFCSDMTRTVWVGTSVPEKARRLYETVLEAHQKAKEAVRAGVPCHMVDRAARRVIASRGWGKFFSHSTGHGVGLEIHESPRVAARVAARASAGIRKTKAGKARSKTSKLETLPAGAVITIEPGVYLPGFGGVRIEDMVVVRESGYEVLTPSTLSPLDLLEIA